MSEKYLIKTYGHCGSMFVKAWLTNTQNCSPYGYEHDNIFTPTDPDFNNGNNFVVHTHTYWLPPTKKDWRFVHVCRKDIFSQVIGQLISNYTKQPVNYDDTIFDPIEVSYSELEYKIADLTYWNKIFDLQRTSFNWKNTHKIYFEDFIENNQYLDILKYTTETKSFYNDLKISRKNPRKHTDVIKNYHELLDYYNKNYNNVK